jgi:hypothetical protein
VRERGSGFNGWLMSRNSLLVGPAGLNREEEFGPSELERRKKGEIKRGRFEFGNFPNSNHTHTNKIQINPEKSNSHILP